MDELVSVRKRRQVMLISPDFGAGGAERSIAKLSFLLSEFCDVHFVVFNTLIACVYPTRGHTHSLDVPSGKSFPGKLFRLFQRIKRVRELKKRLEIDTSISFLEGADYVNVISKRQEKVIVSLRSSKEADKDITGLTGWLRKSVLLPWLYKQADRVVSVNGGIKAELIRTMAIPFSKISVINNYYDIIAIQETGREQLPKFAEECFNRPVIITSGRLHKSKNHEGLLQVASILKRNQLKFRLIILGEGDLLDELLRHCEGLDLRSSILKNGHVETDADVLFLEYQANPWSFISRAQVFLLTSSWEGFPNALAEAMCLGVPVISTDCPHGPREMLMDGIPLSEKREEALWTPAGVLVPLLSEDQRFLICADVIQKILSDTQLSSSMGRIGVQRMQQFSFDDAFQKWKSIVDGQ